MPLASCPDCHREVSTRAHKCVHCGRPWPARKCSALCVLAIGAVLAAAVAASAILVTGHCPLKGKCPIGETLKWSAPAKNEVKTSAPSATEASRKAASSCCPLEDKKEE